MGKPLDKRLVSAYASEFAKHTILKQRGFAFLLDISGKLFKSAKPSLKDVEGNTEVWDYMEWQILLFTIVILGLHICIYIFIILYVNVVYIEMFLALARKQRYIYIYIYLKIYIYIYVNMDTQIMIFEK